MECNKKVNNDKISMKKAIDINLSYPTYLSADLRKRKEYIEFFETIAYIMVNDESNKEKQKNLTRYNLHEMLDFNLNVSS